jgi:hypothetical protein
MTKSGPATQFKRYAFRPEAMEEFLSVWREIVRVRKANGFTVSFALLDRENAVLNWAVSHPDFADGAARYYADPARKRVSRTDYDPATGAYSDDPERTGQRNIEDYILMSDISWVEPEPIP